MTATRDAPPTFAIDPSIVRRAVLRLCAGDMVVLVPPGLAVADITASRTCVIHVDLKRPREVAP